MPYNKEPYERDSETDLTVILLMQKRRFFTMTCLTSYNTDCPIQKIDKRAFLLILKYHRNHHMAIEIDNTG